MSTLLTARELTKSYSSHTLFTKIGVQVVEGDRVGLIGPNGAGKSTLVKILAGLETPDEGEVIRRRSLRTEYLSQDDAFEAGATPLSMVAEALAEAQLNPQERLDTETRAIIALSKLGFETFDQPIETLSGGWRKRVALARAMAHEPDVLFLDEPTNHLDLEGVVWLERFCRQAQLALVFVTHDRQFLENVAARILELSPAYPDGTFEVKGNYSEFVRRKEAFLEGQRTAQTTLANRIRRDTAWLRQGIQGRQTRNKTQVGDAANRRAEMRSLRGRNEAPEKTTTIDFQATERKSKKLIALHSIQKSMGGRVLFSSLDLLLSPGRRIGLLGPNGTGKTTLLRLISGDLEPDGGTIKRAADLRVVTFSQHRDRLVGTQTLAEALCPIGDTIEYRGKSIHISGWARKFLFAESQLTTFVSNLSGGEQARVLIAQLMLEPADVLLLDEPTNDLGIPSLEVLEQALLEFPGALLLVTHDRFMLERIATEYLALDGSGGIAPYASIAQWQTAQDKHDANARELATAARKKAPANGTTAGGGSGSGRKKLGYKLQREVDGMEQAILDAESRVESLEAEIEKPAVIADHVAYAKACDELAAGHTTVKTLYDRWAELEALRGAD